jgi:hypothetical protein
MKGTKRKTIKFSDIGARASHLAEAQLLARSRAALAHAVATPLTASHATPQSNT